MSDWGQIKEGCPVCGGIARWYDYTADCRGNPGSSGAQCMTSEPACKWSEEQTRAFWSDLSAKKQAEYERQKAEGFWDA